MDIPLLLESRGKFVCCHFGKFCDLAVFNRLNFIFALAKESEDKENLPKRTSSGGFKFTFSHPPSTANGTNSANSKSVVAQTAPASSNGSSSKTANLAASVTATKVCERKTTHKLCLFHL